MTRKASQLQARVVDLSEKHPLWSLRRIGEEVGRSGERVRQLLLRAGVPHAKRQRELLAQQSLRKKAELIAASRWRRTHERRLEALSAQKDYCSACDRVLELRQMRGDAKPVCKKCNALRIRLAKRKRRTP